MKIAVFGATGRTGRPLVEQALSEGFDLRALVRDVSRLPVKHERLQVVVGDVMDPQAVEETVAGADAVVSVLGPAPGAPRDLLSVAAANIVAAMKKHGVRRLVALTGAGVADPEDPPSLGRTIMVALLKLLAGHVLRDAEGYARTIRESGLDWTVVRAPRLTDGPRTGRYRTGRLRLGPGQTVARADVADCMLKLAQSTAHVHEMPMIGP
ncbi:MAG TPA: SDR family oxidoreductase [Chloroflexota bacterium]